MKKTPHRPLHSALLGAFLAVFGATAPAEAQRLDLDPLPVEQVNADSIMKHIVELSSQVYEGRLAGTTGHERAMAYAERVMRSYGLTRVEEQRFATECNEVENAKFNVYVTTGAKERRVFTLGNEFCCAGMTGRGYVDAQMTFVGYGVCHPTFDEYKGVDVKGKVAVVLAGLPQWLPASVGEHFTTLRDKARMAERHGAIAMLVINAVPSSPAFEPQVKMWCGERPHLGTFPILQLTLDCGREIFTTEREALDSAIVGINRDHRSHSFTLFKHAEIDVNARYRADAPTYNVLGMVEGSDRIMKNEIVVIGASLDGPGRQGETCLFPAADVNASGVAAVLEAARILGGAPYRPKRSILFVLFSSGEQQWQGSREFLMNYPRLKHVEAFVNVQNVGGGDSLLVLGDGRYPTLWAVAQSHDSIASRRYMAHPAEKSVPRGDARAFDQMRIPSIVITTQGGLLHNHTTTDLWENIDRTILERATRLAMETVADLADGRYQGRSPQSKGYRYGLFPY